MIESAFLSQTDFISRITGVIILSISGHKLPALLPGLTAYVNQLFDFQTDKMDVNDLDLNLSLRWSIFETIECVNRRVKAEDGRLEIVR